MKNLLDHECLSANEERELGLLAMAGNKNAKEKLVNSNLRFVSHYVKKFAGYGLDKEDLFQEGVVGLCQAVEHFNPNKGARLTTYASFWIRNAVLDAINESGCRVRLSGEKARKLMQLKKYITEADSFIKDKQACLEYACECCKCSLEEAKDLLLLSEEYMQLDTPIKFGEESGKSIVEQMTDSRYKSVEDEYIEYEMKETLKKSIGKLKPEEQKVLNLHYGLAEEEAQPFSSIAGKIGKSRARVHQIEQVAMSRLQKGFYASGF